jgi:hypothetical protein
MSGCFLQRGFSMRRFVPVRVLTVALAAGSLTAVPLSSPAPAAVVKPSCTKLVSPAPVTINKILTSKSTVSGCTPLSATGGSGKSVTNLKTLVSTTTWAGGKGTTIEKVAYKASKALGKCAKGTTHILSTGTVTGGSGAALKAIPKGSKVSASVCVTSKSTATLEPGTKYVF